MASLAPAASAFHTRTAAREPGTNFCGADTRRRGRFLCNASSCWRSAKSSRMRSWRGPKPLMIQPIRCRNDANIADVLSKGTQPGHLQVTHSKIAQSFNEGRGLLKARIADSEFLAIGNAHALSREGNSIEPAVPRLIRRPLQLRRPTRSGK